MSDQQQVEAGANDVLGYPEAAKLLGIAQGTLYVWVHRKVVPHYRYSARCVRFSRAGLQQWLDARFVEVGGGAAPVAGKSN